MQMSIPGIRTGRRVRLDFKSYQITLTEYLCRSIGRNRSLARARICPNRTVGVDALGYVGVLRAFLWVY
jgi:hypothetical protein